MLLVWLRLANTPAARILNNLTLGLLVAVYTPLCIGIFFAAGRLTVAPLRSGLWQMDRFGCCSQALVFPQDRIPAPAELYERQGVGFVDTLAEEYADAERLERWALVPPPPASSNILVRRAPREMTSVRKRVGSEVLPKTFGTLSLSSSARED